MWLVFLQTPFNGYVSKFIHPKHFLVVCVLTWPRIQGNLCLQKDLKVVTPIKQIAQKPCIVLHRGHYIWPPTPNQCTFLKHPSNLTIELYKIKFHKTKKNWVPFNDPPVETLWKKRKEKKSKHLFPKLPKNSSFFFLPFCLGTPGMLILRKTSLRSNIPRLKKQPRNFIQVVLREFFPLWCHLIFFSSEILSWCFTSFLRHTLHLHGISLNKITVFVESQRFFVTTKTAKARTDLGLSGVIRLPTQIMHYLLQGKSLKITKHLHQVWSPKNW